MSADLIVGLFFGLCAGIALNELALTLAGLAAKAAARAHVRPSSLPRVRW